MTPLARVILAVVSAWLLLFVMIGVLDTAAMMKALGAERPVAIGDSIAVCLQLGGAGVGPARIGASPRWVLEHIPTRLDGGSVLLSTGLSNAPDDIADVPRQIEALRAADAGAITIVGLGSRRDLQGARLWLQEFCTRAGLPYRPFGAEAADRVHPANCAIAYLEVA